VQCECVREVIVSVVAWCQAETLAVTAQGMHLSKELDGSASKQLSGIASATVTCTEDASSIVSFNAPS
jgi:hypothetical protein